MVLEYAARTFRSEEELCRTYKFSFQKFQELKDAGMSLSEIMLELAPQNEKTVVYQGVVYANRKQMCEALGLDYYRYRSAFARTGDIEQSVEFAKTPAASRKPFEVDGKTYNNYMEFCEETGIPYSTLINMVYVRGMTVEEARNAYLEAQKNKPVYRYKGKAYPSLRRLCLENGFSYMSIHAQVRQGVPLEDAIKTHLKRVKEPKKGGPVTYRGKEYSSLAALTKAFHCSYPRVYAALGRGLTIEEAMANERGREDPAGNSGNYRSQAMICHGKTYPSLTACLQENGIAFATYYRKKQDLPDMEPSVIVDAILSDPKYRHRKSMLHEDLVIRGKRYATQKEAAQKLGISITSITTIMRKYDISFEEAVEERLRRQEKREKEKIEKAKKKKQSQMTTSASANKDEPDQQLVVKGESFSSQQDICKKFGLTVYKVKKAMVNQDRSFSEAAEFILDGGDPDQSENVMVHGRSFSSITSALSAYGISFDLFQRRRRSSDLDIDALIEELAADIPDLADPVGSKRKKYIIHGKSFASKKEALGATGLSEYRVNNYMSQHQCSFEVAVEMLSGG